MTIEEKARESGLLIPEPPKPGGNYVSLNIRGTIAFFAIQFPKLNGDFLYQGRLGKDLTTEDGYKAMQICALNVIAQVKSGLGFDRIIGLNHIDAYYQTSPGWDEAPKVVDGASDVFVNLLGEKGLHTRAILGVESLPKNFSVGLAGSFTVK